MFIEQDNGVKQTHISIKKFYIKLFTLLCMSFIYVCPHSLHGINEPTLVYYLNISDFAESFIEIPTSNVSSSSPIISSSYLAGRADLYDVNNNLVGTCTASFLCMQNSESIYTDISNFISVNNGLIVTWFTPTTLVNLELDSIINGMVTECIVLASTNVGFNPFYGQTFNLVVSSDNQKIYFAFTRTGTIF